MDNNVEELLKPRYKVIADFPRNCAHVGRIFQPGDIGVETQIKWDDYPHLFKKLEWYEERNEIDMPMFLKNNTSKPISFLKIDKWSIVDDFIGDKEYWAEYSKGSHYMNMWGYLPATKEEYENQNK